ncbi:MAG: hypothetical protein ABFD98_10950 [Syntrophobacteraceae bacterium]|nr:hypothetical protein [Desulfobacteraceae bacterium]
MDRNGPLTDIVGFLMSRISRFSDLKDNWDGCCAFPVKPSAIARAARILQTLKARNLIEDLPSGEDPLPGEAQAGEVIRPEVAHGGMEIGATQEGGIRFDWIGEGSRFTAVVPPRENDPVFLEDARFHESSGRIVSETQTTDDYERIADLLEDALRARS